MAKLEKGDLVIDTDLPVEITRLKSQGFTEVKHDKGGEISTAGPAVATNETSRAEAIKPAPKSTK